MLGRSVFQPADFTGLRSAFLRITMSFRTVSLKMSIRLTSPGRRLPLPITTILKKALICRDFLPFRFRPNLKPPFPIRGRQPYCRSLGSTRRYSAVALCMHIRGAGKKKVYIVLDVPVEQLSAKAEQLFVLFGRLPYAARQVLGFVTYAKEPQSKKGLHLMFVEKGDLRLSDRIEKDYLFELGAGRVINADLKWSERPYLDFAWETLLDPDRSERFCLRRADACRYGAGSGDLAGQLR